MRRGSRDGAAAVGPGVDRAVCGSSWAAGLERPLQRLVDVWPSRMRHGQGPFLRSARRVDAHCILAGAMREAAALETKMSKSGNGSDFTSSLLLLLFLKSFCWYCVTLLVVTA